MYGDRNAHCGHLDVFQINAKAGEKSSSFPNQSLGRRIIVDTVSSVGNSKQWISFSSSKPWLQGPSSRLEAILTRCTLHL